MLVTLLEDWNNHLHRGEVEALPVHHIATKNSGDSSLWTVGSSKEDGSVYLVQYTASGMGEQVFCSCLAAQHGKSCKHGALVLARVYDLATGERFMDAPSAALQF